MTKQDNPQGEEGEEGLPHIPHTLVAYALNLKPSLVYNVRSGRRNDCHGIEEFVERLQDSLQTTRTQQIEARHRAQHPVLSKEELANKLGLSK
jgi:hypothetical protein